MVTAGRAQALSLTDATELLERREAELRSEVRLRCSPAAPHCAQLESAERDAKRQRRQAERVEKELASLQIARPMPVSIPDLAVRALSE